MATEEGPVPESPKTSKTGPVSQGVTYSEAVSVVLFARHKQMTLFSNNTTGTLADVNVGYLYHQLQLCTNCNQPPSISISCLIDQLKILAAVNATGTWT